MSFACSDEMVWQCIGHGPCAFRKKTDNNQGFCKNRYNVDGLCTRTSCPLANANYGTIVEENGLLRLHNKVVERANLPNRMWEIETLPTDYAEALKLIDERLIYVKRELRHKTKQRLTKLTQMLIRMKRLESQTQNIKLTAINKKRERREKIRQIKALAASKLEKTITRQLMERLRQGVYGDIYNLNEDAFKEVLDEVESMDEDEEFVAAEYEYELEDGLERDKQTD